MKHLSLEHITTACGGSYFGDKNCLYTEVTGITIDSRLIEPGYLFIPMIGVHADGHDFIPQVIEDGALCVLSEKPLLDVTFNYILVKSCAQALKDIAAFYRESLDIKVVGITGSVGKTSTKEMVASVLEQKYKVLKTAGNFNNEIGLPLTLFRVEESHQVAVLEMGINQFGEMSRLTQVAQPDIGIITNIGDCHLEFLENRDGVLRAKSEMFESMDETDTVILNGMDEQLRGVQSVHGNKPMWFGLDNSFEIYASDIKNLGLAGTKCKIHLGQMIIEPTISIPGSHMVLNALAGACVGVKLGLSGEEICTGIEALKPVAGRNNILQGSRFTVIDDCYNANPISMKASLDVLNTANTRKVAILGDMGELGSQEVAMHSDLGEYAAGLDLDILCCIGSLAQHIASGAENNQQLNVYTFATKKEFLETYHTILQTGDTILIKSSNFMKFNELVTVLCQ